MRGGGDIATGTICRLHHCGYKLLVLETENPTAIRRTVALSEAVHDGLKTVEGVTAERIETIEECAASWARDRVPLLVDPAAACLPKVNLIALIDAIVAKKNCGTTKNMAPITIGLGPGFYGGKDVHAVIETARGHQLGRTIYSGSPLANSGIPGTIGGYTKERVLYAPHAGTIKVLQDIGSRVTKGEVVARIGLSELVAPITGLVRGMIRNHSRVAEGFKIGDIDPRIDEEENCYTISDKARCISGGVLEALLFLSKRPGHLHRISQDSSGYAMEATMEATMEVKVISALSECLRTDKPAALVTVVATTGSAPGKPGALMVVHGDGRTIGTVGGGSLEHKITIEAVQCIGLGKSKEVSYDLQADAELGMSCGGSVRAFIRVFKAAPQLIIIGAGHIGLELYKIGRLQGFQIVVFDERPELASRERFPEAKRIVVDDLPARLQEYELHSDCYVTIATSSHDIDCLALEAVIESDASYIGMIGSSNKIRKIFEYLLAQGVPRERVEKVFAPMGLNIASIRPEEIAIAIIGEILLVKNNGSPEHMRAVKKIVIKEEK